MKIYFWIVTLCACFSYIQTQTNCKNKKRCRISRIHRMKGADCYDMKLREFPQCLPDDIEIIEASYNRIRKLSKDDLKKYSNLKMLYLSDNAIMFIDDKTFEGKDDLTTLDLSLNALQKLPPVVFHLPSLSSLYLGQNLNINIVDVVEQAQPVTSPLVRLDISYTMTEEISELPNFGVLPFLTMYNISGNKLVSITTKHFAGLCSLKILDTGNVTVEFEKLCDCWTINRWLKNRQVQFQSFGCEILESDCSDEVPPDDLQVFNKCIQDREELKKKNRMLKGFYISMGVIVPAVLIILIYFIMRRKRFQRRRKQMKNEQIPNHEEQLLN